MPLILNDFVDPMTAMSDRIQKREVARRLAQHMQTDEKTAEVWLGVSLMSYTKPSKKDKA